MVKKVEVNGNQRISTETIIIFGDITVDKDYSPNDINILIKKLYDTTFFSNISVSLENEKLLITLEENPIVNSIVFNGEKAVKFQDAIKEALTLREKTSFIENYIMTDIKVVKQFYRQLGYYFIKLDVDIEKLNNNRVNIIYNI